MRGTMTLPRPSRTGPARTGRIRLQLGLETPEKTRIRWRRRQLVIALRTRSAQRIKRTGKGDAAWYGSGDCYGIYYDSKGESHRVYCGSWEEELLGKYYQARD